MVFGSKRLWQAIDKLTGQVDVLTAALRDSRHDALTRRIEELTRDLAAARRDIADLRALIQTWRAETRPAALGPERATAAPRAATAEDDPAEKHRALMTVAAGISQAQFTCHRDLWAFFLRKAANEPHFHIPGCVEEVNGKIRTTLSGPTLLATLTAMWEVRRQARGSQPPSGDWALAHELYEAVAAAVETVRDKPRHRDQQKVVIVIDRQPGDGDTQRE